MGGNSVTTQQLSVYLFLNFHSFIQQAVLGLHLVCVTAYRLKHECVRFSLVDTTLVSGSGPMGATLETCSGFWKRHLI